MTEANLQPVVVPQPRRTGRSRAVREELTLGQKVFDAVLFLILIASPILGMLLFGATSLWTYGPLAAAAYLGLAMLGLRPLLFNTPGTHPPGTWLFFAFWCYALLHVRLGACPLEARIEWLLAGTYLGLYLAWTEWSAINRRWKLLLGLLLAVGSLVALYAVVQHLNGSSMVLFYQRPDNYGMRASGTYVCPNHFAHALEILMCLALALAAMRAAGGGLRVLAVYTLVICSVALFLSLSRSGILGAFAGLTVTGLLLVGRKRRLWMWVGACAVPVLGALLLAGLWFGSAAFKTRIEGALLSNPDASVAGRLAAWSDTVAMIKDAPLLGHGGGSYRWVFLNYKVNETQLWLRYAHNEYLQITAEYGGVGMGLLVAASILVIVALLRAYFKAERDRDVVLAAGALGALAATLVHACFDFNLHIYSNLHLLVLMLGVVFSQIGSPSGTGETETQVARPTNRIRWIRIVALPLLGLVLAALSLQPFFAERNYERGKALDEELEPGAQKAFERALAIDKGFWRAYEGLGDHYSRRGFWALNKERKQEWAELALVAYEQAIRLNPVYTELLVSKGRVYAFLGEHEQALALMQEAADRSPKNKQFHKELGSQLRAMGHYQEALDAFMEARRLTSSRRDDQIKVNIQWLKEKIQQQARPPSSADSTK